MVLAKPALWAEPAQCSGAAEIKPPFEMGVGNFRSLRKGSFISWLLWSVTSTA